ncbi:MAG: DedA family protein [Terriglobales bacterium]
MLRFIRQHPIIGLIIALSVEAWLALPGEAMIALAASALDETYSLLRMAIAGVAGMLVNTLVLYGISRAGRGVLVQWFGFHHLHFHLSPGMVLGANFLPPLRSLAYVLYGFQGTPLGRFVAVSVISSIAWVGLYLLLGRGFHKKIDAAMHWLDGGGRWVTVAEVAITLVLVAVVWI